MRLDDEFHVDELLWYFTVIKLQQDAETASILDELDAWEYYRQQASILATGDNRLQEIHVYSSITDVPCIVYCQNKKVCVIYLVCNCVIRDFQGSSHTVECLSSQIFVTI